MAIKDVLNGLFQRKREYDRIFSNKAAILYSVFLPYEGLKSPFRVIQNAKIELVDGTFVEIEINEADTWEDFS
ncbi:MAG: hypothetical protein KGL39_58465, partial [Patescibacteria group bacterium]|nr:hypothetical protein [Patescibacteria group bacterium]